MKRIVLILLLIAAVLDPAEAGSFDTLLQRGNRHYLDGEYELAARAYQSIVDSGYTSAELYYNLGNSYYKSNNITMALVNYERAHILDPRDPEILNNLEVAREFVVDRIEVLPEFFLTRAWKGFVKIFDADIWAILSIASFLVSLLLFLGYFFTRRPQLRRVSFWTASVILFISISTLVFAAQQDKYINRHREAIIRTPSVTIKSSPDEDSGTDLFLLHEGTKVRVEDELGDWREVVLSDGNRGWLKEADLIRL